MIPIDKELLKETCRIVFLAFIHIHLNPIALRKAKTLLSFGFSECNRVKLSG